MSQNESAWIICDNCCISYNDINNSNNSINKMLFLSCRHVLCAICVSDIEGKV